ncbi:MAG: carboxynorspermidine decarboxylase [Candidatus Sericytochromatia bacterium]|nr:carboxynorspermidine decarboxylase [Candidatus Sericytochromatia bacterium]
MAVPLDIRAVPTPAYVLEEAALKDNLRLLDRVQRESGGKVILALKGFAFWSAFPWVREVLHGATASSLHEARLAREEMRGEVHVYSVAFSEAEFPEILALADHLVFNSFSQWRRFKPQVMAARQTGRHVACGIRVNPGHSEIETPLYDPCYAHSRLGVTLAEFRPDELDGLDGLHFHAHCGNGSDTLERVVASFETHFGPYLARMKWVNFGGGHHITKAGYDVDRLIRVIKDFRQKHGVDVYLEPGEAVGWRTGPLVASVLDVVHNGMDIAILDTSATAHMPDTLEMPYRPEIRGSAEPGVQAHTYRLGGVTCLAGDVIGDYSFAEPLQVGDKLVFEDMIHYTIVKNSTFNGIPLPSLCIWHEEGRLEVVRQFGYDSYKYRNS